MKVHVEPDDIRVVETDKRGRVYLGTDLKNAEVELAILEVNQEVDENE